MRPPSARFGRFNHACAFCAEPNVFLASRVTSIESNSSNGLRRLKRPFRLARLRSSYLSAFFNRASLAVRSLVALDRPRRTSLRRENSCLPDPDERLSGSVSKRILPFIFRIPVYFLIWTNIRSASPITARLERCPVTLIAVDRRSSTICRFKPMPSESEKLPS